MNQYLFFLNIPTRWKDQDVYQHVNNITYYSYFDTVINYYLIKFGKLDPKNGKVMGLVVETTCQYKKQIEFPEIVKAGIRVKKIGRTSCIYEVGLFTNDTINPVATGNFVHVFVDRTTRTPIEIPSPIRTALESIQYNVDTQSKL
eukprot:TRINITY_DN2781_c2_g1_i3.p1 TRINITY_DN2781_c2_g1~~TRINITY_DN2781_c2_g1_i3.p1  ORF type:complete len:145 (+),score=27.88 TRINITY_DN2781_c2_g1_i3:122-556(+)